MNVAGTLQEAGDADSRDHTRSQVKWDVSSFFIFIHLLNCLFCIRNAMSFALLLQIMEGWWGIGGGRWFILEGYGWGTLGGYHHIVFVLLLVVLYFVLSCP